MKFQKIILLLPPFSVFFFKWILMFFNAFYTQWDVFVFSFLFQVNLNAFNVFIRSEMYLFPVFFFKWILMLLIPFYTQWDVFVFSYLFQVNFNAFNAFCAQWDIFVCLLFNFLPFEGGTHFSQGAHKKNCKVGTS